VVPVVLLTGFLGSGKTTLLNRFLALRQERARWVDGRQPKLAILVNELGAVGIDAALMPPGAARQVELPGGCICCTLDENLEKSVGDLLDVESSLEMIVIETTGIAEPLPILWTLGREPLSTRVRVAAVVTVVDALEHERNRPLAPAVDAQVEHADVIVLSKLDLVEAHGVIRFDPASDSSGDRSDRGVRVAELVGLLRESNPSAAVLAEKSAGASALALARILADPDLGADRARPARGEAHIHASDRHGFETLALPIEGTLDFEELTAELEALPAGYVRIKGICHAIDRSSGTDEPFWIAFHRVGARVSAEPLPSASERVFPCIVALGTDLDADQLAACVRAAVITSEG
jgi:G3E family GTPase